MCCPQEGIPLSGLVQKQLYDMGSQCFFKSESLVYPHHPLLYGTAPPHPRWGDKLSYPPAERSYFWNFLIETWEKTITPLFVMMTALNLFFSNCGFFYYKISLFPGLKKRKKKQACYKAALFDAHTQTSNLPKKKEKKQNVVWCLI